MVMQVFIEEVSHMVGCVEWIGRNTKWIVSGLAAIILMIRRDAATILCLIGAITNAIFGKILKRIINEARPKGARLIDPGMPSSHAQSLFYFATYLILSNSYI